MKNNAFSMFIVKKYIRMGIQFRMGDKIFKFLGGILDIWYFVLRQHVNILHQMTKFECNYPLIIFQVS